MSYAILWTELLAVSLLWTAAGLASAGRTQRKGLRVLEIIAAVLAPLVVLGIATWLTASLKYSYRMDNNRFGFAASLLGAYTVGAVAVLIAWRGAAWPFRKLWRSFMAAALFTGVTFWKVDATDRAQLAGLKAQASADALALAPPVVDDDHNAATLYAKAFATIQALSKAQCEILDSDDIKDPHMVALLDDQTDTMALLRRAAARPQCRFDTDYSHPIWDLVRPNLTTCKQSQMLLHVHGQHELAEGRVDSAMDDIRAMFAMSRHVATDPTFIAALVATGMDDGSVRALEECLPAVTRGEQLAGVNIDPAWARLTIQRSLRWEEAADITIMSDVAMGRVPISADTPSAMAKYSPLLMGYRVFFALDELHEYQGIMERSRSTAAQPYFRAGAINRWVLDGRRPGLLSCLLMPSLSRSIQAAARCEATDATAVVAVAATRYRLDHGKLPPELSALVPIYLDQIPLDPFDGKPLRLAIKGNEWRVYSVGPDGKDDGGTPMDRRGHGDIVFTLRIDKGGN